MDEQRDTTEGTYGGNQAAVTWNAELFFRSRTTQDNPRGLSAEKPKAFNTADGWVSQNKPGGETP